MKLSDLTDDNTDNLRFMEAKALGDDGHEHKLFLIWDMRHPIDLPCKSLWRWRQQGLLSFKATVEVMNALVDSAHEPGAVKWHDEDRV